MDDQKLVKVVSYSLGDLDCISKLHQYLVSRLFTIVIQQLNVCTIRQYITV